MKVFLLWHTHAFEDGNEDDKLLGVYSTRDLAEEAQARALLHPGFCDVSEGFCIDAYEVDGDKWMEGYVTVT
jgi:hypothetical protein